jgi:hypothetical protein
MLLFVPQIQTLSTVSSSAGDADLVTETDKKCEELVLSRIRAAFPDHKFIGEERSAAQVLYKLVWGRIRGARCAGLMVAPAAAVHEPLYLRSAPACSGGKVGCCRPPPDKAGCSPCCCRASRTN